MRGEVLFEKMTGISEEYITEAALVPAAGASPAEKPESRFAALSRVLNSGWGVACICFIVAIAAVVGMVAWGRMGDPAGPGSDPSTRFAFSYEMTANDGSAWSGTANPGDVVNVSTTVVNHGKAFATYDFFAYAKFVLQEDESVVIEGHYPLIDTDKHTVENGGTGNRSFHFHIPENATPGVYDLVLSYDGEQQVFSGALTVGETVPPVDTTDHPFSFGYMPFGGDPSVGSTLTLEAWVINEGEPFSFVGDPYSFMPTATLYHRMSGYTIIGYPPPTGMEPRPCEVLTGQKGASSYDFRIPADAPMGEYDLVLSYGGAVRSYAEAVNIVDPTVNTGTFSFGYQPLSLDSFAFPGLQFTVDTWIINSGEAFTFEGASNGFAPEAALVHMENGYRIESFLPVTGDWVRFTVNPQQKGTRDQIFRIPTDAPTGDYALQLSYGGVRKTFENVLTVAAPIVEEPTVLSNLTMAVGEEWLYEPIEEAYVPDEKVTVRFKFAANMEPLLILNGVFVESKTGGEQQGYWEYSFTMPDQDSAIYFYSYDKTLPYAAMLESCIAWDHYNFSEKKFYYYGEFGNGVMVALLLGNSEQVTGTSVGLYQFITPTTHEMLAYYNGGLYWLKIAYEDYELLTEEDLADLFAIHKSLFPDCYDNWPSPK
ncbi:MAG: hypothetical protein IJA91_06555 [Clostridia bacterium]|nr:hypothetical protein [Clostridia bacterium]